MELIRGLRGLRSRHRPCVATIGAFDGVHRGHLAVLAQLREQALAHGLPSTLVTFEPLPREYLQRDEAPARLTTLREKIELLAEAGVERLLCLRFDETLRRMQAEAFIDRVMVRGLGVASLILGDDFRFGRAREGNADMVRAMGAREGFATLPTATCSLGDRRISSTRVRRALAEGDFALAEALLGRAFTLGGRVRHGRALGRQLGAPTANIGLQRRVTPLQGVYAVTVDGAGLQAAPAVANIGRRPTVADNEPVMMEVHVLDGAPDLYGQRLIVTPRQRLRSEQRFADLDALRRPMSDYKSTLNLPSTAFPMKANLPSASPSA
jgi:riboflavin kinase/FMN adenylyltransferase